MPVNSSEEPGVQRAAVRRFKDTGYLELAPTLGELRQRIDALDGQIVALLAQRALCVKDATRFKRDAFQVAAPARQAQVFERVKSLAEPHAGNFPGFEEVVASTYRAMVTGFIAGEAQLFQQTELIDS